MNLKEITLSKPVGFPDRKNEDWKYSNVRLLEMGDFQTSKKEEAKLSNAQLDLVKSYEDTSAHNVVMIDGQYSSEYSCKGLKVSTASLNRKLEAGFTKKQDHTFFEELCFEQAGTEWVIEVSKKDDKAIHMVWINTTGKQMNNVCVRLSVASGVETTLRHVFIATEDAKDYFNNVKCFIALGRKAKCSYEEGFLTTNGFNVLETRVIQKKESELVVNQFSVGSQYTRSSLFIALEEESASCDLKGSYALSGKAMTDYFVYIAHLGEETKSKQLYKGLLDNESTLIFNGEVYIGKVAFKAESEQLNHNLALSETAKVFSRPQLDIYCDDVKCGHGSAMGKLGQNEFFYICSRGISKQVAKKMMATGFIMDVVQETSEAFKALVVRHLMNHYLK